jgi:hypothetical protein
MKKTALIVSVLAVLTASELGAQNTANAPRMMLPPLTPQGEGVGIHPGRVVWTHAPGAINWDKDASEDWYADQWVDAAKCDRLMTEALTNLTGENSVKQSWDALFRDFNDRTGKGKTGYLAGEKIAIKVNQNNTYSKNNEAELNASPQMVLSLLHTLIEGAGIPQHMISVIEPSRHITDALYDKCHAAYPDVRFVDQEGGAGRIAATYVAEAIPYSVDNGDLARGLSTDVIEADYLINMALLKGHVGQGVTLCGKNWYGVTSIDKDWRKNFHNNFDQDRTGKPKYMTFVDFMSHKDLGAKTVLFLVDGLLGSQFVSGPATGKWKSAPFAGQWPNSLLASQDGVAIDAVGFDMLVAEYGSSLPDIDYGDAYLVEAANADNPPSGTVYDPERDGTPLTRSLGAFEHWNNPRERKYSRNLGKSEGIELVYIKQ